MCVYIYTYIFTARRTADARDAAFPCEDDAPGTIHRIAQNTWGKGFRMRGVGERRKGEEGTGGLARWGAKER